MFDNFTSPYAIFVAYTWETELTKQGNVAAAWEGLIDSRKLPYMAGLRNMRNIFLCDINAECQGKFLNYLKNRNAVERSKQMPFQFFTAFNALDDLKAEIAKEAEKAAEKTDDEKTAWEKIKYSAAVKAILGAEWKGRQIDFKKFFDYLKKPMPNPITVESLNAVLKTDPAKDVKPGRKTPKDYLKLCEKTDTPDGIWGGFGKPDKPDEIWAGLVKKCRTLRYQSRQQPKDTLGKLEKMIQKHGAEGVGKCLEKFKKTVNAAMLTAVHNVPPVHGTTIFFIKKWPKSLHYDGKNQKHRGVGADLNVQSLVLAASAMISCQDAVFYLYEKEDLYAKDGDVKYRKIEFDRKLGILEMVKNWLDLSLSNTANNEATLFDVGCLESARLSTLDRAVFLNEPDSAHFMSHLACYRARFNPKFKSFFVGKNDKKPSTDLVTYISGCSEQVLRYLAEDGKDNAINQIVSFPARFGIELDEYANTECVETIKPRIRELKIFISSTFLDLQQAEFKIFCCCVRRKMQAIFLIKNNR